MYLSRSRLLGILPPPEGDEVTPTDPEEGGLSPEDEEVFTALQKAKESLTIVPELQDFAWKEESGSCPVRSPVRSPIQY